MEKFDMSRGSPAARISAGFAHKDKDITPPLGIFMPGYYADRRAKEMLDPLQINCVAFSDGVTTALVMQLDTEALFEAATFGGTHCIVINGAQGDLNHCNVQPLPGEMNGLKRDFDAVDRGYDHARHMANVLAAAALKVWMKCIPLEGGPIRCLSKIVRIPAQKAMESDEKNLKWADWVWEMHESGRDAELPWKDMELTTELARARRILRMASHPDFHDLPIYGIAVGSSLAFAAFPGEPFNDIGKAVKKGSPFALTILSCLTNGSRGYFPFSDAYAGGGYESASSPYGPSVADDLIAGQLRLLDKLAK